MKRYKTPLLNQNIKVLRRNLKLTQEKFAVELGVKRSLIGAYEEGRATPPSDNLLKMANLAGISIDTLISEPLESHNINVNDKLLNQLKESIVIEKKLEPITQLADSNFSEFPLFAQSIVKTPELKSISQESNTHSDRSIYYINTSLISKFIKDPGFKQHLQILPKLQLPFLNHQNQLWAFDSEQDFPLENSIIVAEQLLDFNDIKDGDNHLILTKDGKVIYRRVYNQLKIKGLILTNSDKIGIQSSEILLHEIAYIMFPVAYFSKSMPMPEKNLKGVLEKINALKSELEFLGGV